MSRGKKKKRKSSDSSAQGQKKNQKSKNSSSRGKKKKEKLTVRDVFIPAEYKPLYQVCVRLFFKCIGWWWKHPAPPAPLPPTKDEPKDIVPAKEGKVKDQEEGKVKDVTDYEASGEDATDSDEVDANWDY
ncbi:hypothetical protein LINGRAHAP2_LOCUS16196 [Linum grandiflorum]